MTEIATWEQGIYDEILNIYQTQSGIDLREDPIIYSKIIELMGLLKDKYLAEPEKLKDVVVNAIILMLTLFFNKKPDDFDDTDDGKISEKDRAQIKSVLSDALNMVSSGA